MRRTSLAYITRFSVPPISVLSERRRQSFRCVRVPCVIHEQQRFPADFVFRLTKEERDSLMLQFATSKTGRGGQRKLPLVFTEHGAIMAANVLNSQRAVRASVEVVRAFVHLRRLLASNEELARKVAELEKRYDSQFKVIFYAIRQLMTPPQPKREQIGFRAKPTKR